MDPIFLNFCLIRQQTLSNLHHFDNIFTNIANFQVLISQIIHQFGTFSALFVIICNKLVVSRNFHQCCKFSAWSYKGFLSTLASESLMNLYNSYLTSKYSYPNVNSPFLKSNQSNEINLKQKPANLLNTVTLIQSPFLIQSWGMYSFS